MNSLCIILRQNVHRSMRQFHKCVVSSQTAQAAVEVEPMTIPVAEGLEKPVSPKIDKIVNDITALNLIEVSELSDLLKKRLNLPDAPIMPVGGFAPVSKTEDDVEPVAAQAVKTSFTLKLMQFDDKQKVPLIKEIKNILPGMNLVQAKKFVESAPSVVKADISKEEADKLNEILTKVGAVTSIE